MAGTRVQEPMGGIGIPNLRIGLATLVPVPAGTPGALESDFTQAGPQPGSQRPQDADNKLSPFITNAQEVDTLIEVSQAGSARREGCMVTVRGQLEADTELKGWIPPTEMQGWTTAVFANVEVFDMFQAAVIPSTQEVIVVAKLLSTGAALARRWDPVTKEFVPGSVDILAGSGIAPGNHASVVVLPGSEDILAMVGIRGTIFRSKDKGATWSLYSLEPLGVTLTNPAALKRDRMAITPDGEIVLFHATATASEVAQFASSDEGATWEEVETTASLGNGIDVTALPDGTIGVTYGNVFARLASPFDPASAAPTIALPGGGGVERALWTDFDGTLYALRRTVSSNTLVLLRSKDSGTTWETFQFLPWSQATAPAATAVFPQNLMCVPREGGCALLHNFSMTGGTFDGSIGFMMLGGWSNVLGGVSGGGDLVLDRAGWGGGAAGGQGATWVPIDLPGNMGYTETGTAPTLAVGSIGELDSTTVGAVSQSQLFFGTEANMTQLIEARVRSGGALSATVIGSRMRLSDGVNNSDVAINFDGTGFRVQDLLAATDLATVAIDLTANDDETDYVQVKVEVTNHTALKVFYRRGTSTNWIRVTLTSSTLNFTGVLVLGAFRWRQIISGTANSRWRQAHVVTGAIAQQRVAGTNILIGKGMGSAPYPVPDLGAGLTGSKYAFMGLESGPGTVGERYDIDVDYVFGVKNIFIDVEPSRDVGWRALNEARQRLVFDLGRDTIIGKSIFSMLLGVQQRTCNIGTAADGDLVITPLGTFDSGGEFDTLAYLRSGDSVRPTPGFTDAERYLFQNEVVKGHVLLSATIAREILFARAGHWTGTVRPELVLDDIDGSEPASGDLTIVAPDAVHFVHTAGIRARYIQFDFPAATDQTPKGYIGCGSLAMGYVQPMGQRVEWDYGVDTGLNRDEDTSPYGTTRFRELGPPSTDWSGNHASGIDMIALRQAAPGDLNYIAPSSDLAGLVAQGDVWLLWRGLVAQDLKSGEIPCIAFPFIPDGSNATVCDRSLWTFGRIAGSVNAAGVVGDEGVSELMRILTPSVQEIR